MKNADVNYLVGGPIEKVEPLMPFDDKICDFLADLSAALRKNTKAQKYTDIQAFAFFCRRANIMSLKEKYNDGKTRMGRGLVFHIAPSNVPVNCVFSYVFGLLAGNVNVVRVSTKTFDQVEIICEVLNGLFTSGKYDDIEKMTAFVRYPRDREINDHFSKIADARVIWGGNQTIEEIRKSPVSARCMEVTFADRYSFAILDALKIADDSDDNIKRLAENFYNDTYLMDQNACSTPHLILWKNNVSDVAKAGEKRFWTEVYKVAEKYKLEAIKASDKYELLCEYAIELDEIESIERYENKLYVVSLKSLPEDISILRGKFGLFFQHNIEELQDIKDSISPVVQTCCFYGVEKDEIKEFIIKERVRGIDRVVPIGSSLNIDVIWDGYDVVGQLSRIIE